MTDDDQKAKDLLASELDPKTRADLERWFGLPSFDELAEKGIEPVEDAAFAEARERQERALAAVDPVFLEVHRQRTDPRADLMIFEPAIDLRVDPSIALLDMRMADAAVAEPREREIPEPLKDDLKDCTPQALLRDLHRPETDFEKIFEVVDVAAEQRLDVVAAVTEAMTTNWKLELASTSSPYVEARQVLVELAQERRTPWGRLLAAQPLPNRRWTPEEDR